MRIEFLTPLGGLLALVVLVPLAAFLAVTKRSTRVRATLNLPGLPIGRRIVPVFAILAVAGLLALAAAQPVVTRTTTRALRSDVEMYVTLDISRSMLARSRLDAPTRLQRAKEAAARLRASVPEVPVGIAAFTNRVLPYLFPSTDTEVFRSTLERAIDIEHPPPGSSFLALQTRVLRTATSFSALSPLATQRFYLPSSRKRILVVLTDGESSRASEARVGVRLRKAGIETVFVQFWASDEQVYADGKPELRYNPDPTSRSKLDRLAVASHASVYDESDLAAAVRKVRDVIGSGPTGVGKVQAGRQTSLAPYLTLAAFFPLLFLLWWRDR